MYYLCNGITGSGHNVMGCDRDIEDVPLQPFTQRLGHIPGAWIAILSALFWFFVIYVLFR
jgi:hypothetical protein